MKLAVIGAGYVGLVSGACFADFGHVVTCIDTDARKIDDLRNGRMPIYEPGLEALVASNIAQERLSFTADLAGGIEGADVIMIAVGTPSRASDGQADLTYVYGVASELGPLLKHYALIVTKSTVPVGTADEVERIIRAANPPQGFSVASNPEFLREGAAIRDFKTPDRIVVGTEDAKARELMSELYRPLYLNQSPMMFTGRRTAELIKYAANAFLATKITFINELADLCEAVGADVQDVARGIGADNRIGNKFLHAGPGYGGSCFPKDTQALITTARDFNAPLRIVETVAAVNEQRKRAMGRRIIDACDGIVRGKKIAILGATFKPNTDDIRDAPAISIVRALEDAGAEISIFDPHGMEHFRKMFPNLTYAQDAYDCAKGASALAIVTEWEAFRALDLKRIKASMAEAVLVDLRNIYRASDAQRLGFKYISIGRPTAQ
jgi:UDPglucose 6-dehydrogenase